MTPAARLVVDGLREALADPGMRAEVRALFDGLEDSVASAAVAEAPRDEGWLNTQQAAKYLGTTPNALHKATAARTLRFVQNCPGGRCYFRREDLDAWRRGLGDASRPLPGCRNSR